MSKKREPAIEGWFEIEGDSPRLLGTKCRDCGTYFFPKEEFACRNPRCAGSELDEVPLSKRGRLWSFTNNCYQPPAPYVSPEPFEPYAIAAVELAEEKMVVLGQVVAGVLGVYRLAQVGLHTFSSRSRKASVRSGSSHLPAWLLASYASRR